MDKDAANTNVGTNDDDDDGGSNHDLIPSPILDQRLTSKNNDEDQNNVNRKSVNKHSNNRHNSHADKDHYDDNDDYHDKPKANKNHINKSKHKQERKQKNHESNDDRHHQQQQHYHQNNAAVTAKKDKSDDVNLTLNQEEDDDSNATKNIILDRYLMLLTEAGKASNNNRNDDDDDNSDNDNNTGDADHDEAKNSLIINTTKNTTTWIVPGDIIKYLSVLLSSAQDLLAFSMISKRFYNLTLKNIKNFKTSKEAQTLINLHVRQVSVVKECNSPTYTVIIYESLPSGICHGKWMMWTVAEKAQLTRIVNRSDWVHIVQAQAGIDNTVLDKYSQAKILNICLTKGERLLEGYQQMGVKEGKEIEYIDKVMAVSHYVNGFREGNRTKYRRESGRTTKISPYVHGKKHGTEESYDHHSRTLKHTADYENGKLISKEVFHQTNLPLEFSIVSKYHANGCVSERARMVKGLRHGPTQIWSEQGKLMSEKLFSNGKEVPNIKAVKM